MENKQETRKLNMTDFAHHWCTSGYTHWSPIMPRCLATSGAVDVAERLQCWWLLDAIGSYQGEILSGKYGPLLTQIQFWTLHIDQEGRGASLVCQEDSDRAPSITQEIPFTDITEYFSDPEIKMWVGVQKMWGDDPRDYSILYLPSEH